MAGTTAGGSQGLGPESAPPEDGSYESLVQFSRSSQMASALLVGRVHHSRACLNPYGLF